jgi:4-nitrophenyl phosphatase
MPGLREFFATMDRLRIGFVLATNNAAKTAEQYVVKLAGFGIEVPATQIVTSAEATASYLRERHEPGTRAYIVGESGLYHAMENGRFRIVSPEEVAAGATAQLVVVGFNRDANYKELAMGALLVHKGATFIGTNPDPSFPSELGPLPGAGALQAVITTATGVQPTVIGKPGPIIFRESVKRLGGTTSDTAMVGDRLSTDIAGGRAAGLPTILLLSGISSRTDVEMGDIVPDYVFEDISELARVLGTGK